MTKAIKTALYIITLTIFGASLACGSGGGGFSTDMPQRFFGPTAMVVTPDYKDLRGSFLYVINSQGDSLSILDTKFRAILKHHAHNEHRKDIVWLGGAPHDIAITPDGNYLYITDALDGVVLKVEAHPSYRVEETEVVARAGRIILPVSQDPERNQSAYITSPDTFELIRMVVGKGADIVSGRINLPGTPAAIAATPDLEYLMVTTEEGDLLFVSTDPFMLQEDMTVYLGGRPGNLITDKPGDFLFVMNNDPPQIQVVDLESFELTEEEITFDVPLADMALGTDGTYIYMTSQTGEVYVFSTEAHRACGASSERVFFKDLWPQSNPSLVDVEVFDCVTRNERWFVEYDSREDNWKVKGTWSGTQSARAKTNQFYLSDHALVGFRILPGTREPSDGDTFYFETDAGFEPIRVGLVPDGLAVVPYWEEPWNDLIFVANTGTHNISILFTKDKLQHVSLGAVN